MPQELIIDSPESVTRIRVEPPPGEVVGTLLRRTPLSLKTWKSDETVVVPIFTRTMVVV